jgi:hypothetical protein
MATFGTFASGQVLTAAELNTAGAMQTYTPTWTQSATITKTVNWARYTQLNKWVYGSIQMTATGAGTVNNKILVDFPVNASANNFIVGTAYFSDASASPGAMVTCLCVYESATTFAFVGNNTNIALTTDTSLRFGQTNAQGGSFTLASGDIIRIQFAYEAA